MSDTGQEKPLIKRHKEFVDEYFFNGNKAYDAYRKVYPNAKENSARTKSYQLLQTVEKSSYFQSLEAEKLQKEQEFKKEVEKKFNIDREWLLAANKRIYDSAMEGDFIPTENGSYQKLDRSAACKAIDQITKIVGEYADVKAKLQLDVDAIGTIKVVREEIK